MGPESAGAAEQQAYAAALAYATPVVVAGKGDTLRFNNLDAAAQHDLDSDQDGLFDSPLVPAGKSAPVTGVDHLEPGTYSFHCSLHAWMKGSLVVNAGGGGAAPPVPLPNAGGGASPDPMTLLPTAERAPLGPGRWPVYGKDRANSRNGGTSGPSYNEVPRLGPVWSRLSKDGDFTATPMVAGNTLVIGSSGGTVFALDPTSGKLRWKRDLIPEKLEDGARITGSVAMHGRRVFVPVNAVGHPTMYALDVRDGTELWHQVVDRQERADMYGSPQESNGRVYIGTSGYFGEQVTGVEVSARGSINALDARTGKLLWKTYTVPRGHDGGAVWSTPAVEPGGKRIYVGSGNAYHPPAADTTDSMFALTARPGRVIKHFQATSGDAWNGAEDSIQSPDADFGASPNLFTLPDGRGVIGQGQKSGTYWVLDRRTMTPVWNALVGPGSFTGGVLGSTAFDDERIYGPVSISGQVWALKRTGAPAWNSTDGTPFHFGAVAISNGVLYANDMAGFLTAREALTGLPLAKIPLGASSWAGVSVAGGSVFTATGTSSASGYVVAYRPRD
jgi:polyvinyl alcohol dehydrogenase (cytochrome)